MKKLKEEWKKIDKDLKHISKRLHGKIYGFLFSNELEKTKKSKITSQFKKEKRIICHQVEEIIILKLLNIMLV